jgi:hypothetical protein
MTIQDRINRIQQTLSGSSLSEIERDIALHDIRELYLAVKEGNYMAPVIPKKEEPIAPPKVEPVQVIETPPAPVVQVIEKEEEPMVVTPPVQKIEQKQPEPEPIQRVRVMPVISIEEEEPVTEQVMNKVASLNEVFADDDRSLNSKLSSTQRPALNDQASRKDLKSLIDLNKQFVLTNELFDGDSKAFANAIDRINEAPTIEVAFEFIKTDLLPKYRWSNDSQSTRLFDKLVRLKFGV